jgi:hypothetical protein
VAVGVFTAEPPLPEKLLENSLNRLIG